MNEQTVDQDERDLVAGETKHSSKSPDEDVSRNGALGTRRLRAT